MGCDSGNQLKFVPPSTGACGGYSHMPRFRTHLNVYIGIIIATFHSQMGSDFLYMYTYILKNKITCTGML